MEKPVIGYCVRGQSVALISDPDAIKTILCSGEQAFPKWLPIYRNSARLTGADSILAAQGDQWSRLRTALNLLFAPSRADLLLRNAGAAAAVSGDCAGVQDVFAICNRIAIDVMWRTILGADETSVTDPQMQAISDRMVSALQRKDLATAAYNIRDLAQTISTRPPGPAMPQDHPFRHLTLEGGENTTGLSDAEIWDNLVSLIYAGQETTSLVLSWALWILGQDPDLQAEIWREIMAVPADQVFSRSGMARLGVLNCVVKETMRLLPPAIVTVRTNTSTFVVADQNLSPGTIVVASLYALHRSTNLWRDRNIFRPARFQPDSPEPVLPMAFIPFTSGRHICIAAKSSIPEIMAILAAILRDRHLVTQGATEVSLYTHLVMRPTQPLLVAFTAA